LLELSPFAPVSDWLDPPAERTKKNCKSLGGSNGLGGKAGGRAHPERALIHAPIHAPIHAMWRSPSHLTKWPIEMHNPGLGSNNQGGAGERSVGVRTMIPRAVLVFVVILAFAAGAGGWAQDVTRTVTDSAGRRVEIPARISRVLTAGPPASILLCTLAPEKMIGWVRTPSPTEKAYLHERVRELPEYGRLTGRGGTANLENVLKFQPDLIIDSGSTGGTYVSLANNVQEQTKIPYLLLDGRLEKTPEIYRLLGEWLDARDRAEQLANYAEETLSGLRRRIASIPESDRPRVYYGRGINGLESGLAGSINMEVLERVGAINVAAAAGTGSLSKISIEQVLAWNPDVILVLEPAFYASVRTDPLWRSVKAVRENRIYMAPNLPYGWFDAPPGVNRLIGVRWLMSILYPKQFPEDLRTTTREFYRLFYQVNLTDAQLDILLTPATSRKQER
jgi:iron complex transport system substrate-binding protein